MELGFKIAMLVAAALNFAVQSLTSAVIACGIFFALWAIYTVFLFRRKIFKKHYAKIPEIVWDEKAIEN